jgi:hypothetical protein
MRKRNVSAVYESSYDTSNNYPSDYSAQYDGGSGNIINMQPAGSPAGSGGGGQTGFPKLPTLPTGTQQPTPNLDLYNLRCPNGFKMVRGKCKSVGTSGSGANGTSGTSGGANGTGANGGNATNDEDGANGATNDEDIVNSGGDGSGGGTNDSGTNAGANGTSNLKKYLLPIAIIGILVIGYFSIKKVLKNG